MTVLRPAVPLSTPCGVVDLEVQDYWMVRVTSGTRRPLVIGGAEVCVSMSFVYSVDSERFQLSSSLGPVAWRPGRMAERLDGDVAHQALQVVDTALNELLAGDEAFSAMAKSEALRRKIQELDAQILVGETQLTLQKEERSALSEAAASVRRATMRLVRHG